MKQSQRNVVMNDFRRGKFPILIATDVAARGIDVDDVEAVINFDLPAETSITCTVSAEPGARTSTA